MKKLMLAVFLLCLISVFLIEENEGEDYYQHPPKDLPVPRFQQ